VERVFGEVYRFFEEYYPPPPPDKNPILVSLLWLCGKWSEYSDQRYARMVAEVEAAEVKAEQAEAAMLARYTVCGPPVDINSVAAAKFFSAPMDADEELEARADRIFGNDNPVQREQWLAAQRELDARITKAEAVAAAAVLEEPRFAALLETYSGNFRASPR
jgi:hypothetical protein